MGAVCCSASEYKHASVKVGHNAGQTTIPKVSLEYPKFSLEYPFLVGRVVVRIDAVLGAPRRRLHHALHHDVRGRGRGQAPREDAVAAADHAPPEGHDTPLALRHGEGQDDEAPRDEQPVRRSLPPRTCKGRRGVGMEGLRVGRGRRTLRRMLRRTRRRAGAGAVVCAFFLYRSIHKVRLVERGVTRPA